MRVCASESEKVKFTEMIFAEIAKYTENLPASELSPLTGMTGK